MEKRYGWSKGPGTTIENHITVNNEEKNLYHNIDEKTLIEAVQTLKDAGVKLK